MNSLGTLSSGINISAIPKWSPGVYILRDFKGTALYVGGTGKLQERVKYQLTHKSFARAGSVYSVDFQTVSSLDEIDPLETRLIQDLHPKYNSKRGGSRRLFVGRPPLMRTSEIELHFVAKPCLQRRARDCWVFTIPKVVSQLVDTRKSFQVTIRPLGTIAL